jgi:hypothetical protein
MDFTIAGGFQKWADLDDTSALSRAKREEVFRKFLEKMTAIETTLNGSALEAYRSF